MNLSNNAVATRTNYLRGVRHLMIQLGKLPQDCSVDQIKAFLVKLRDSGQLSSSSINLRVCGLKYYFRHVVNRLDLVLGIPNPRIAKYDTEVLTTSELMILFQTCRDVRQLLIIQLLFDTGMRSGELVRLELKDFDKENRTIILRKAKGQKLRVIPYGEHIRSTLKAYIKMLGYFPKGALIESYKEKGSPLTLRGLQHIVRQVVKRSLLNKLHQALSKVERKAFAMLRLFGQPKNVCPCCGKGKMVTIDIWLANKDPPGYLKKVERK